MGFVDLCRLCGTDTLQISWNSIFQGEGGDGKKSEKDYSMKIFTCLALVVSHQMSQPLMAFSFLFVMFFLGDP
jgi:hypothetical protein